MDTTVEQKDAVLAALQKLTKVLIDTRPMTLGEAWELTLPSCPVVLSSPFGLRQTTLDGILTGSESLSTTLTRYAGDKKPEVWMHENIAAAWCNYQQAGSLVAFASVSGRWKVSGLASTVSNFWCCFYQSWKLSGSNSLFSGARVLETCFKPPET
ncbi:hypothetical protein GGR57DRAFT_479927 [Xylariaceae sp. FL1272]|nr:hypothetical protein GGR57DRAFT_479927 [Xylariaceae sp. FL1272]